MCANKWLMIALVRNSQSPSTIDSVYVILTLIYIQGSFNKEGVFLWKKEKIIFLFQSFFLKYKLWIIWNWFVAKIILILEQYSFWCYRKYWQIAKCSRLEQKSVFKFLIAGKCKQCEIYRRMYDMYRKACFSQKSCLQTGKTWVCDYDPEWKRQSMK